MDLGTNSTRLMVAAVTGGEVEEIERRSVVTGLGRGTDASGRLASEAIERVLRTCRDYATRIEELGAERAVAVATSAVRDATNGSELRDRLRDELGLEVEVLSGDEEARLTYLGAVVSFPAGEETLVFDIGGGSTELIAGDGASPRAHVSLQLGVLRQHERHLRSDPPALEELDSLRAEVGELVEAAHTALDSPSPATAIAVAGTPNTLAAIDLGIARPVGGATEGHPLGAELARRQLDRLAALPLADRAEVRGLEADRAPMIVPGLLILEVILRRFAPGRTVASNHDVLWGAALELAAGR